MKPGSLSLDGQPAQTFEQGVFNYLLNKSLIRETKQFGELVTSRIVREAGAKTIQEAASSTPDFDAKVHRFLHAAGLPVDNNCFIRAASELYDEYCDEGHCRDDQTLKERQCELLMVGAPSKLQETMPFECALVLHWNLLFY